MPERAVRLEILLQSLCASALFNLIWHEAVPASDGDLALAHSSTYINKVMSLMPEKGFWAIDDDTVISSQSGSAARYAAGCALAATHAVIKDGVTNAFCAVRPPGHHAGSDYSGGFCLFNNIAVSALAARYRYCLRRVAVIDFDTHHGNGTQDILAGNPDFLFASFHQASTHPVSTPVNTLNIALADGSDGAALRRNFIEHLQPRLIGFKPEIMFVSAGFDAHRDDPLGTLNWLEDDYHWLSKELLRLAHGLCQDRVVAVLEGGYNITTLCASATAFIKPMLQY